MKSISLRIGFVGVLLVVAGVVWWQLDVIHRGQLNPAESVLCTADAFECPNGQYVGRTGPRCTFNCGPVTYGDNGDIEVTAPAELTTVSSPLVITGEAMGSWFYENKFSVELLDDIGHLLATGTVLATTPVVFDQYVPFKSTLTFSIPTSSATATRGVLYLHKDNPSHLRGLAGFYRVPVRF